MGDLGIWVILGVSLESGASLVKESACNAGDLGLIPELGRSPVPAMSSRPLAF